MSNIKFIDVWLTKHKAEVVLAFDVTRTLIGIGLVMVAFATPMTFMSWMEELSDPLSGIKMSDNGYLFMQLFGLMMVALSAIGSYIIATTRWATKLFNNIAKRLSKEAKN
jgi:hypothetical protein